MSLKSISIMKPVNFKKENVSLVWSVFDKDYPALYPNKLDLKSRQLIYNHTFKAQGTCSMTKDEKDEDAEPFQILSNFELRDNVENEILGSFDIDLA
jgi:hypothetical protein